MTVTIITFNEELNIARAVRSASWADEVLVVDSGSSDKTSAIATGLGARVLVNAWPGYGAQKNFAQKMAAHDWVFSLDADEVITPQLRAEIEQVLAQAAQTGKKGFELPRKTYYLGRWIRYGGWYPNYLVRLGDRRAARWTEPSVHEALEVQGPLGRLQCALDHFSFSSVREQLLTNLRYSELGSKELCKKGQEPSVLKLILKPIGKFIETYFLKLGFLDGLPGFIISVNAAYSMFLKFADLSEARIKVNHENPDRR